MTTDKLLNAAADLAIIGGTVAVAGSAMRVFSGKRKPKKKKRYNW